MPKIQITDTVGAELIASNAAAGSGFAKYLPGNAVAFLAGNELRGALKTPLAQIPASPLGLGLSFRSHFGLGVADTELKIAAGARATVNVTQPGKEASETDLFGEALIPPAGAALVSFGFEPIVDVAVGSTVGDLCFGFAAGGSIQLRSGMMFSDRSLPLADALKNILANFSIPNDLEDIGAMPSGAISFAGGAGSISASVTLDMAAAINPLAAPAMAIKGIGQVALKAGGSLEVSAGVKFSGNYQIRVHKVSESVVRIGYHRGKGAELKFGVKAQAGGTVKLKDRELISLLMSRLSTDPKADIEALVDAGLSDDQIAEFREAIRLSVDRSLSLSVAGVVTASRFDDAIFEYEFDLSAVGPEGEAGLKSALHGDLAPLASLPPASLPAGVKMRKNVLETLRKTGTRWRINLIGIVNVLSLTELVRQGRMAFDADSGDLVITDKITHKAISVVTNPLAADGQKLRKALMESLMLTAAYRAGGVVTSEFGASQSFFATTQQAKRQTLSDYLDPILGMGLITEADKRQLLSGTVSGTATLLLETNFNDAGFDALFLDANGVPRPREVYDEIGRSAIRALIQPGDEFEFRRLPATDSALWAEMVQQGPFAMRFILPTSLREESRFGLISADYIQVRWWSKAMRNAAERVAEIKRFLKTADPATLSTNVEFRKRRSALENAFTDVVKENRSSLLDAWGVLVMDAAAERRGTVRAILTTKDAVLVKTRP